MQKIETLDGLQKYLGVELSDYDSKPIIDHQGVRIGRVGHTIARAIRNGDGEAVKIGYSIIMKDPHLPFGKLIKSGIARAMKQRIDLLSATERLGLINKTCELLNLDFCPRETEDYCKLVRKLGESAKSAVLDTACAKNEKSRSLLSRLAIYD
jgi:hypothetical protein